jgi:hypothetical protein
MKQPHVSASHSVLAEQWRASADLYERDQATGPLAPLYRKLAGELEAWDRDGANEALTLREAAQESGLSTDHLGRLIRDGRIPNAGRHGAPRVLRSDLPRRVTRLPSSTRTHTIGEVRADLARGVATRS